MTNVNYDTFVTPKIPDVDTSIRGHKGLPYLLTSQETFRHKKVLEIAQ